MHWLLDVHFAEDIDISDSYMGYIERSERSLSLDKLVELSQRLGVSVDYLLQESVSPTDDHIIDQFSCLCLINGRASQQKQMAIDVIKTMFAYLSK